MGQWFLVLWIGTSPFVSPTSSTSYPLAMHNIGPLPSDACQSAAAAMLQSQNVVKAECVEQIGWTTQGVTQSTDALPLVYPVSPTR